MREANVASIALRGSDMDLTALTTLVAGATGSGPDHGQASTDR
jgi:hypothetical protein